MNNSKNPEILVIHGPNLNMLGKREPEIYGFASLDEINASLARQASENGFELETFQSNHEGEIVEKIQQAFERGTDGLIINPAAFTHTSVAIRDALLLLEIPLIEIHLSNVYKREPFRRKSMISDIATAQIAGLGPIGYNLALEGMFRLISKKQTLRREKPVKPDACQ